MENSGPYQSYTHTVPDIPEHLREYIRILCEYADGTAEKKATGDELLLASCYVTNYFLSGLPGETIDYKYIPGVGYVVETMTNDFPEGMSPERVKELCEKMKKYDLSQSLRCKLGLTGE
jgi:hypothetical protein